MESWPALQGGIEVLFDDRTYQCVAGEGKDFPLALQKRPLTLDLGAAPFPGPGFAGRVA